MGKAYSTQLKIRNDTASRITTTITKINPKQWFGPNRPDQNFHNVSISPGSEYSREECINIRAPVSVFTMVLDFENRKRLEFRIDQGRVAGKKRCRCRSKEKNKFTFVGDDTAFDVKDSISGNTLTIEIKDSYMFKFGSTEEARQKAEMIAKEQAKAAELARVKAEAERKAIEEDKARREALARMEEEAKAKIDEEKRKKEEEELEVERVAHRLADAQREKANLEEEQLRRRELVERRRVEELKAIPDEHDEGEPRTKYKGGLTTTDNNLDVGIGQIVHVPLPDESILRSGGQEDNKTGDYGEEIVLTTVKFEPRDTTGRRESREASLHRRKSSAVTLQVLMNQDGDIRVQIEEDASSEDSDEEEVFAHVEIEDVTNRITEDFDKRELVIKDVDIPQHSSQVIRRSIESHF